MRKEISLKEYLKVELKEAKIDYSDRIKAQEYIKRRHYELGSLAIKAKCREELITIIKVVNSWLINFDQLEVDRSVYIGNIPECYLDQSWCEFVKEWKPKFQNVRDAAIFKIKEDYDKEQGSTENNNNLGGDSTKDFKQIGRPKKGIKRFEELLNLSDEEKNRVFDVIKDACKSAGDRGVVLVMKALKDKPYFTMPGVRAELWGSLRQLTGLRTTDTNLNSHYVGMTQELREEIQRWSNKLP
ncbi:MAG: hypothetical protein LLF93_09465 [Bacteroidales bacterium]|nr:hypothetical protein [Bacteroidales bacterium]